MKRQNLRKVLNSTPFSLAVLTLLVAILAVTAYYVTTSVQQEPDFGGMITIRQADMDISGEVEHIQLTRDMILEYITDRKVLLPAAKRCEWNEEYEEMVKMIDVKERLASQNSYIIMVNTRNMERSMKMVRILTLSFLEDYQKKWKIQSRKALSHTERKIAASKKELQELKKLKERFQNKVELRPLNTEIEMKSLNEQLVAAQTQFLTAYGAYIAKMEEKRSELQLELNLALQSYTEDDAKVRSMRRKLKELDRQCREIREKMERQKPNLYRMTMEPEKLTGLPNDILYFYDNVQTLQQIKLALMLGSIIEEKEMALDREEKKKRTIERLIESNSSDVFIRGGGL